jgi:hypothetical protein
LSTVVKIQKNNENLKMTTLPKQEIFKKLFVGLPVESSELFQTIKGFSPTGAPKILKKTPENL